MNAFIIRVLLGLGFALFVDMLIGLVDIEGVAWLRRTNYVCLVLYLVIVFSYYTKAEE